MATFKHKTIRRFRVGEFEFKNYILAIPENQPEKIEQFKKLFRGMPPRDRNGIVEINEEALAALERPVGQRVVKGVADHTGVNKTPSTDGIQRPVAEENGEGAKDKANPEEGPGGLPELQQNSGDGEGATTESPAPTKPEPVMPSLLRQAPKAGKQS